MRRELKPFLEDTFATDSIERTGLLEPIAVRSFWSNFLAGNDGREWSRVWSLAILIAFINRRPFTMKTLLLCPELFARESGIQRILRLYLKALCETAGNGDRVDLVVLNDLEFPAAKLAAFSNDRLALRLACGGNKAQFLWAAVHGASDVDRLLCGHFRQLVAAWLARCFNPRLDYYLVAHGIEVWKTYSALEKLALRRARRILCVSEFTRREMQRRIDLPEWRFEVVPNALDPFFADDPSDGASSDGPPVILSVARLDPRERYKGVDHLIEALPAVRQAVPGARLRIVGSGGDLHRLVALAEQKGVADAVEFAGFVDDQQLREAYRDCTLFALPSCAEGFGIVFLEAMARGKPCLGARAGAVPEIIDQTSGVLAGYGNLAEITDQVVWALQQKWDSRAIKARAAQFSYPAFKARLQQALGVGEPVSAAAQSGIEPCVSNRSLKSSNASSGLHPIPSGRTCRQCPRVRPVHE